MKAYIKGIKRAVQANKGIERAVERINTYICSPREMECLLKYLWALTSEDPRYLKVYELLHRKNPQNVLILEYSSLACYTFDPRVSIDENIKMLTILHQTDKDYPSIRLCYNTIALQYEYLGQFYKAIAAYTLALSYFHPESEKFIRPHHSLLEQRARLYLKLNKLSLAKQDVTLMLQNNPQNTSFKILMKEIEKAQASKEEESISKQIR
jgi:tetratricopeptide (TPR) repeat protein